MITTQTLRDKISELGKQKEQVIAQLNALCGAEQVLRELLSEAENEEASEQ